jgi:hypothetical protein
MWGTLTDVSLHGCYIEMNTTFPVGTRVQLTLESLGVRVRVPATVRVSYPSLGMGMCFSDIEPGQPLQRLLDALLRPSFPPASATSVAPSIRSLADLDAKIVLDELERFFRTNQMLSRQEFDRIAKRAGR